MPPEMGGWKKNDRVDSLKMGVPHCRHAPGTTLLQRNDQIVRNLLVAPLLNQRIQALCGSQWLILTGTSLRFMPIRRRLVLRASSIFLGLYSGLGLLLVLLKWGIYNQFYAEILGDRVGAGIFETAIRGVPSGTLVFLMVFLTTNAAAKWKTTKLGTAGALAGLLNTAEVFGISAVVFYLTPYLFGVFQLAVIFMISGVVGVSTYLSLYDWRLSDVRDLRLKLQDLKFVHDDSLKSINLIAWASIVFVTGGVVAGLTAYSTKYELGSPQEIAAKNIILLFLIEALFIGIGVWLGWIAPYFRRLEAIRLELRKLDVRYRQDEGADTWPSTDRSRTREQTP